MRICLIAEGSYPYITGGVSSWVNQLMTNMPEYEFQVVAISPDHSREKQYAYKLPENLIEVYDIYLDDTVKKQGTWNMNIPMTNYEVTMLEHLLLCGEVNWQVLFQSFAMSIRLGQNAMDIILSDVFYQCVRRAYNAKYFHVPFNQVFWTLRSMFTTVFALMFYKYPRADVYHAVSAGYAGLIGAYAAQVNHGSFLLTEHGIYTREREEEIIKADWVKGYFKNMWIEFFYQLSSCAYSCADQVITLFNYNKTVEIELGCPPEKIDVIHNGIDINKFAQTAKAVDLRNNPGT